MNTKLSEDVASEAASPEAVQERPTEATWRRGLRSIRLRLALAGALVVCIVIGALTAIGLAFAERRLEDDLREEARITALAVADDLELRADAIGSPTSVTAVSEFLNAAPAVRDITLYSAENGPLRAVLATSASSTRENLDPLAMHAVNEMRTLNEDRGLSLVAVATPILRGDRAVGAVLVTVSLAAVVRLRNDGRLLAALIAAFSIAGVAVVIFVLLAGLERQHTRMREELWRIRELATIGQTMANVAHQLGTPLNLASAHVQLLQQELPRDRQVQRRLGVIEEQLIRVTESLRSLLDRARPKSAHQQFLLRPVLSRLAEAGQILGSAQRVRVTLDAPETLPLVTGDETQLELALSNLVTNALDAMPDGGNLSVTATAEPGCAIVEIADTGTGIAPEVMDRIFEPWVTTKVAGQGTGLGLSIARDVVQRMGGAISANSRPTGGTVLRITLPSSTAEAA
ncbi:MAG TPA: ATP-binding protein [Vicinamibacterales bacterium]|nr:ATP-binding protein [Vicinamibacterales bacterium]